MKISLCLPYMVRDFKRKDIKAWCEAVDAGPFHRFPMVGALPITP